MWGDEKDERSNGKTFYAKVYPLLGISCNDGFARKHRIRGCPFIRPIWGYGLLDVFFLIQYLKILVLVDMATGDLDFETAILVLL